MDVQTAKYLTEEVGKEVVREVVIDGEVYATATGSTRAVLPPEPPCVAPLLLSTLGSLVTYLDRNRDELELEKYMLVVRNPRYVTLEGPVFGRHRLREKPAAAEATDIEADGHWMELEQFIVWLSVSFEPTENRDLLLEALRKINVEDGVELRDDGISQSVTVKKGTHLVERAGLDSVIELRSYSTFREVEQPEAPYLFRMAQEGPGSVRLLLQCADRDGLALRGIENVAFWLLGALDSASIDVPVLS